MSTCSVHSYLSVSASVSAYRRWIRLPISVARVLPHVRALVVHLPALELDPSLSPPNSSRVGVEHDWIGCSLVLGIHRGEPDGVLVDPLESSAGDHGSDLGDDDIAGFHRVCLVICSIPGPLFPQSLRCPSTHKVTFALADIVPRAYRRFGVPKG